MDEKALGPIEKSLTPRARIRGWLRDLLRYSRPREPPPPRGNHIDRGVYGAAQPLLGLRLILSDWEVAREAMTPVLWMVAVCIAYAMLIADAEPFTLSLGSWKHAFHASWLLRLRQFYFAFGVLAAWPPVLFANHYARFAAMVRFRLGFGTFGPREMPLLKSAVRVKLQAIVVAVALAPLFFLVKRFPFGGTMAAALLALWTLHWVVVEAFDDANVLQPGQTLADVEREADTLRRPWFVRLFRWFEQEAPARPRLLKRLLRMFASSVDRLSKPWREEIALLEANPRLSIGFSLATAALLATPLLNLLFRPVIIAGATHLLGHIEHEEHSELPEALAHDEAHAHQTQEKPLGERLPDLGRRFR
jgi:hypothetical protein